MLTSEDIGSKGITFFIRVVWRFIPYLCKSFLNYSSRPKLKVTFGQKTFIFKNKDNVQHHFNLPCLMLENNSKDTIKIDPSSLCFNRENYMILLQFPLWNSDDFVSSDTVFKFYKENWLSISQSKAAPFDLTKYERIIFPLYFYQKSDSMAQRYKETKLWFSDNKISVRIKLNLKEYEYAIDRVKTYETAINWLSFWDVTCANKVIHDH